MKLIFVHGRDQQGKDRIALQREWTTALRKGFFHADLRGAEHFEAAFPYYGDLLSELSREAASDNLGDRGAPADASVEELEFQKEILLEMAAKQDISKTAVEDEIAGPTTDRGVQNWEIVLAALRLLDGVDGLGALSIERFTNDVWAYLTRKGLRGKINEIVDSEIPHDEACVIVAHSLGTVIAYNVLMDRPSRANVKAFITLGSPLGIEAIYSRLPSDSPPRTAPSGVSAWYNARDDRDVVSLYEINPNRYRGDPVVHNCNEVDNISENRHGIVEYLADTRVAHAIYTALV